MSNGQLYIVATPIGNLADMSPRAVEVLQSVDFILAEDTRHSAPLLKHFQIKTDCKSFHEHNENQLTDSVCGQIQAGKNVALISDAGTPLISDPGFPLVKKAHELNIKVISLPGPCAAIAAIAASGMPVDRFCFEGFLPHKSAARKNILSQLMAESRTMIFYESPHRIEATIADMCTVFGQSRHVVFARELSKLFETTISATLGELQKIVAEDNNQKKGEIVLVVEGNLLPPTAQEEIELDEMLRLLLAELPLKKAVALAVKLSGKKKNTLYQRALEIQDAMEGVVKSVVKSAEDWGS